MSLLCGLCCSCERSLCPCVPPVQGEPPPWPSARANPAAGAWSMATAARRGTRRLRHWRMRRAFPRRPVEAAAGEVSSLVSGDGEVEVPSSPWRGSRGLNPGARETLPRAPSCWLRKCGQHPSNGCLQAFLEQPEERGGGAGEEGAAHLQSERRCAAGLCAAGRLGRPGTPPSCASAGRCPPGPAAPRGTPRAAGWPSATRPPPPPAPSPAAER